MGIFSKINSCLLAIAVVFSTLGQVQTPAGEVPIFPDSLKSKIPAFSGLSSHFIWDLIDIDSSSILLNLYSKKDSEEDSKNSFNAENARESYLKITSALYLLIAKDIDINPTIGELLYPFHFYF